MVRVGLLYGGRSGEHDVSLCSAASVAMNLDRNKYQIVAIGIDRKGKWHVQGEPEIIEDRDFGRKLSLKETGPWLVNHFEQDGMLTLYREGSGEKVGVDMLFPVLHGTYCEDGTLQGLLELARVPYVGADVIGSAVGMDKDVAKRLLRDGGIPVVPWITVRKDEWEQNHESICSAVAERIGFPAFVKPSNAGSSVGIKKVKRIEDLPEAMDFSFRYDLKILVEKAIDCREIECAVLGNGRPEASALGEIIPRHEFYSYEAKYIDPDGASLVIPADLGPETAESIRRCAVQAYLALACSGMARVDFFLDKKNGLFYLNEINTLPGFTTISMYPKLWEYSGLPYPRLLDRLIELALDRHRQRESLSTTL